MKVVLPPAIAGHETSRFGFVHFADRASVLKALKNTEKYELNGQVLECSLAKPQADQKSSGGSSNSHKAAILPSHPPRVGYGLVGGAYGALTAGYGAAAAYPQPFIYGRGPSTAGMAMMPMLLPDGRIGYVSNNKVCSHTHRCHRRHNSKEVAVVVVVVEEVVPVVAIGVVITTVEVEDVAATT